MKILVVVTKNEQDHTIPQQHNSNTHTQEQQCKDVRFIKGTSI